MTMYGRRLTALLTSAALATAALAAVPVAAAPASAADGITITPNPAYAGEAFEGWGTSLVWFANATGGYPAEIREQLGQAVFGEDGLDLNIARYNIGGGNAPDVARLPAGRRRGGGLVGARADGEPAPRRRPPRTRRRALAVGRGRPRRLGPRPPTRPSAGGSTGSRTRSPTGRRSATRRRGSDRQRLRLRRLRRPADQIRRPASTTSPPTWSASPSSSKKAHGIKVDTIDPLNEPNTNYWGTQLGPDGQPTGGRQEGAHVGPAPAGAARRRRERRARRRRHDDRRRHLRDGRDQPRHLRARTGTPTRRGHGRARSTSSTCTPTAPVRPHQRARHRQGRGQADCG